MKILLLICFIFISGNCLSQTVMPILLVKCDIDCVIVLNGKKASEIQENSLFQLKAELGENIVEIRSIDGLDRTEKLVSIDSSKQYFYEFHLRDIRQERILREKSEKIRNDEIQKSPEMQQRNVCSDIARLIDRIDGWQAQNRKDTLGGFVAGFPGAHQEVRSVFNMTLTTGCRSSNTMTLEVSCKLTIPYEKMVSYLEGCVDLSKDTSAKEVREETDRWIKETFGKGASVVNKTRSQLIHKKSGYHVEVTDDYLIVRGW